MPVRPIPNNPTRDAILARIEASTDIRPHSSQKDAKGTKYLSAFTIDGVIFVIDKMSAGKQPIWVLDQLSVRTYLDAEGIAYEIYTSDKTRNSNLHKLPNFRKGQLLRIYPTALEQGMAVIAKLA